MDTQTIPFVERILAFSKMQRREDVLVLGQNAAAIASVTRAIDQNRHVVADGLDNLLEYGSIVMATRDPASLHHFSSLEHTTESSHHRGFQLLICIGRPNHTSTTFVRDTLRQLSTMSSPGGRILIEMYRQPIDGGRLEHWSQTEARYRGVAQSAGFRLHEINGVTREGDLPTTVADIHAFTVSLVNAAVSIEGSKHQKTILRVARTQRSFVKGAYSQNISHAADKSLKLLLDGKRRRLFATLYADG